ncbi:SPARC-related modular calcium-binding protein 1-like isoform X2 [Denticeps clupeoides]|uniref:SPARC-related modular calcium-binding protein 1-like isoform X2 n=1 Tax=Denticeps clupeoides TaxID=299321 RepID=UPI0010A46AE5|nr:SPARC-related modular calcium-binding protein 1-like isoform X2 [Denticeps clupeoides]
MLTLTCRVLLVALMSRSQPLQSLIAENEWPQKCLPGCSRGHPRSVCGSNGRLYKSSCAFQRAQCVNPQLRAVPRSGCTDPLKSKCQSARSQALESRALSDTVAVFVPECNADGSFLQVQCHNQTGYCWCSTPDGKPVSRTTVMDFRPNCTGHLPQEAEQRRRDRGHWRPTSEPQRPNRAPAAGITAPPFWVTIQQNSEPKKNRSVKNSPRTCERERATLLAQRWQEDTFVPECTADGRYNPVQCLIGTGYCWCVRTDTGRPLPGTSKRNKLPDCSPEQPRVGQPSQSSNTYRDRPLPGCPGARKVQFLQSLLRALQLEAQHVAKQTEGRTRLAVPGSESTPAFPPSPSPAADSESSEPQEPQVVLRWHFQRLDRDHNGVLSEREARPLRLYLRQSLRPRRCAKKFAQYCDQDHDRMLSLNELSVCLGV